MGGGCMSASRRLFLVRHGQTLFNRRDLIQGWCDSPLTEEGVAQARAARDYFRREGISFQRAYASTSERACDTLEIITDLPYTRLKGLKERHFGLLEGLSVDVGTKVSDELIAPYFGGESRAGFRERLFSALHGIMQQPGDVLAVSHGCACYELICFGCERGDVYCPEPLPNGCILEFRYESGKFYLCGCVSPS